MNADRLFISIVVFLFSFLILHFLVNSIFAPQNMHMGMMFQTQDIYNIIVIMVLSLLISLFTYTQLGDSQSEQKNNIRVIKKALNEDEKKLIGEIEKAGTITQDSLRFRLGWSKAKLSTILSNLDRQGIVQRERSGKTYKVFLEKDL